MRVLPRAGSAGLALEAGIQLNLRAGRGCTETLVLKILPATKTVDR